MAFASWKRSCHRFSAQCCSSTSFKKWVERCWEFTYFVAGVRSRRCKFSSSQVMLQCLDRIWQCLQVPLESKGTWMEAFVSSHCHLVTTSPKFCTKTPRKRGNLQVWHPLRLVGRQHYFLAFNLAIWLIVETSGATRAVSLGSAKVVRYPVTLSFALMLRRAGSRRIV